MRAISIRALAVAVILAAGLLTGCIQFAQTVALNADGSGSLAVVHGMSADNASQLQAMARALLGQSVSDETLASFTMDYSEEELRAEFKAYAPYGVTLESYRTELRDGWRYKHLRIRFKSLAGLARTGWLNDWVVTLTRDTNGNYVFTQAIDPQSSKQSELALLRDPQLGPMVAQLMQGFHAAVQFSAPGKVLETNAREKLERSARWVFDLAEDPEVLQKLPAQTFRVTFDGRGLNLAEFRHPARPPKK